MEKVKKYFYLFIHLNFITGFFYAFYHFLTTPKSIFLSRRLWAYECWIIISFYFLFIYLIILEEETKFKKVVEKINLFKKILLVNLILLIIPWGLFLLLAPRDLLTILSLKSVYWKILGGFSLLGALIYFYPYRFYKNKWTYFVLLFGAIDNFLAGLIVTILFMTKRIPMVAFAATPLLFYFSLFFFKQTKEYKKLVKEDTQKYITNK